MQPETERIISILARDQLDMFSVACEHGGGIKVIVNYPRIMIVGRHVGKIGDWVEGWEEAVLYWGDGDEQGKIFLDSAVVEVKRKIEERAVQTALKLLGERR